MAGWRSSPFPAPPAAAIERTLGDALLAVAARRPDAVAVIDGDRRHSFAALADRVGGLARQIDEAALPPGPVAAVQPVDVDMVAAWFACAAAGRPLVILDPQNPPERNRALATLAGAKILLADDLAASAAYPDMHRIVPAGRSATLIHGAGLDMARAMMIFPTSGSTGTPKLIAHSARSLQAKVQASIALMGAGAGQTVLIAGAHGNFGFVHHALTFLLAGGTLCLFDLPGQGMAGLATTIAAQQVRHVRFTPSLFRVAARVPELASALRTLDGLRFSGEPLSWSDVATARALVGERCRIQNVYGSTESAIFLWTDDRTAGIGTGPAPIGDIYPLWDYAIRDDTGAACDEGHLIVRSRYQALGDWRDGAADPARFPPDPDDDERRLYETGDIVRRDADGRLTMLGRQDRLVKLNGRRVSLAEVEAHLAAMPGCAMAAAIVAADTLAAFVVATDAATLPEDPRRWLAQRLPRHMVPGRIRIVARLPLLPGGKIDYAALARSLDATEEPAGTAPAPGLAMLHDLWARALARPGAAIGIDRDFFDLGGDSLQLLNLRLLVEQAFGRPIDLDAFLDRPTLRRLAEMLALADLPRVAQRPVDGVPRFRRVRPAAGPSRGIALVMPGRGGEAMADPWIAVNALPDHEIWACDIGWPDGHIMQRRRWVAAAEAIAAALAAPGAPHADVLIGFSIGGYIAWLVDRLLATTPHRPAALICLDPVPMHRRRAHRSPRLRRLLARTKAAPPARMLLIRRATDAPILSPDVTMPGWTDADARIDAIEIRTIDHADMTAAAVLAPCLPHVDAFLHDRPAGATLSVDTDSGRMFEMLSHPDRAAPAAIEAMVARLMLSGSYILLMGALYLLAVRSERERVRRMIAQVAAIYPNSMTTRLADRLTARATWTGARTSRSHPLLLNTPASLRHALSIRRQSADVAQAVRPAPIAYRRHLAMAFVEARLHNLRRRTARFRRPRD